MIRDNFDIDYYRSSLSKALPECTIQAQLEQGGQGIVFHAWHDVSKRDLAVKVLAGGAFASPHGAKRFRREVEIMSKMHHPNIVQTYDCGVFDGGLWYAMMFIEGIEVSGWQVIEHPTERKCVELFIKVCDALAYAHRAGYIHRDIKPNNIQVDADDNPFILDFGLARPLPSVKRDDASVAGHPSGTLNYMSPEQVIGEELLGVQTDIYSLGVVMYEVLSGGKMPYPMDGDVIERRRHIIETEPKPIKVFNPKIDQDLSSIVCKCLEKHPADRYDSMDALQSDLRNWLAGHAVTARAGNRWYRWKKTARRHKWPLIAAFIFVVTLLAGTTSTTIMWQRAEDLAVSYSTALEMGSLAKLGSVARDEDRTADALTLWHHALDLADAAPLQHEEVDLMRHAVLHQLAEFHLVDRDPETARGYCDDAIAIAERYADGGDLSWRRRLGFAEIIRGRLALANKDYEAALAAFARSVEIRQGLVDHDDDSVSHKVDLAHALSLAGRSARKLNRMDDALTHYSEAHEIRLALHEANADSADRLIDVVQAEAKLVLWHLGGSGDDAEALRWLLDAERHLDEVRESGGCDYRPRDCRLLAAGLAKYRGIVQKRLDATPPDTDN